MIKQGHMATLTDMLEDNGIEYVIDSKISGEPTDVMISEGAKMYTDIRKMIAIRVLNTVQ